MGVRSDDHTIIGPLLSLDSAALEGKLGSDAARDLADQRRRPFRHYMNASSGTQNFSERVDLLATKLESELETFLLS